MNQTDRLTAQAAIACDFPERSREAKVAAATVREGLFCMPTRAAPAAGMDEKAIRKWQRKQEREWDREVRARVKRQVKAAPEIYGFGGWELWILGLLLRPILDKVLEWLKRNLWGDT